MRHTWPPRDHGSSAESGVPQGAPPSTGAPLVPETGHAPDPDTARGAAGTSETMSFGTGTACLTGGSNVEKAVIFGVFATDLGLLIFFKLLRAAIQIAALFIAQKVFHETYVRKVHVEQRDPLGCGIRC